MTGKSEFAIPWKPFALDAFRNVLSWLLSRIEEEAFSGPGLSLFQLKSLVRIAFHFVNLFFQ
jgi:hypothetical protein